jgi:1,4-dihydroxy-2-naphthoate octaprenyltransferase
MEIISGWMQELTILSRLARLRMTIFSAVTYSVAYTLGMRCKNNFNNFSTKKYGSEMNITEFLIGWAFVLCCQISAHLLGEYYDLAADRLCKHDSPFTGGSRVLVKGEYSAQRCHDLGWLSASIAATLLISLLPPRLLLIGAAIVILSTQYSGFPLRLNHRALGEVSAALIMNVLLPYFGCLLAAPSISLSQATRALLMLIVPSSIIKFALFLVLNLADMQSDAAAGKITLPVLIGEEPTRQLYVFSIAAAYSGALLTYLLCPASSLSALLFVLLTAYPAYSITLCMRSYASTLPVLSALKHAPLPVIAIFVDCFTREILYSKSLLHVFTLEFQIRCLPMYPYVYSLLKK